MVRSERSPHGWSKISSLAWDRATVSHGDAADAGLHAAIAERKSSLFAFAGALDGAVETGFPGAVGRTPNDAVASSRLARGNSMPAMANEVTSVVVDSPVADPLAVEWALVDVMFAGVSFTTNVSPPPA